MKVAYCEYVCMKVKTRSVAPPSSPFQVIRKDNVDSRWSYFMNIAACADEGYKYTEHLKLEGTRSSKISTL